MDCQDVRVVETARGPRFLLEASQAVRILCPRRGQHLDGDIPGEPCVPCSVHLAHPARAEWGENLVRPELRARAQRHRPLTWSREYSAVIGNGLRPVLGECGREGRGKQPNPLSALRVESRGPRSDLYPRTAPGAQEKSGMPSEL